MSDDLPPVVIPSRAGTTPKKGECEDCGRWLPPERWVCGRCANKRNEERARR